MIFSTSTNSINKMIRKFYQPKSYLLNSMSDQLQKIIRMITHYKSDERAQVSKVIMEIQRLLTKNKQGVKNSTNPYWLIVFKSMLLIHELLTMGIMGNVFGDSLELIDQALAHIKCLNDKEIVSIQQALIKKPTSVQLKQHQKHAVFEKQMIYNKFLKPYYNYLTKRCQILPKGFSQKSKCYYLINLLSTACSCNEIIYTFGRYSKLDEFFIMGDFNLVLAKDVYLLYGLMRECIDFDVYNGDKSEQTHNNTKTINSGCINKRLNISEVDDILLQTHEKLYHIFYNKYNFRKTQHFIPEWINLDQYQTKSKSHPNLKQQMAHINFRNINHMNNTSINNVNNNMSFMNKSKFYDQEQHLALDETACSIVGQKQPNHSKFTKNSNNTNISTQVREQSLLIIHDLQEFLQKFDQNI